MLCGGDDPKDKGKKRKDDSDSTPSIVSLAYLFED